VDAENSLAEKVAALINAAGNPSYENLAREIKAAGGPTISAAYLWQLRTGARDNPTFQHLQALSRYFSLRLGLPVNLAYFDPATPIDQPWVDAGRSGLDKSADGPGRAGEQGKGDDDGDDRAGLTQRLAAAGVERISARYGEMGTDVLRDVLAVMDQIAASRSNPAQDDPGAHADK
jgi:ESX-1-secreted protein regulator